MHIHGMNGICMPVRTSIGRPQRTTERMETVAASAIAASRTIAVEPLPLAAVAAHIEPPARVGVGSEGVHGCPMVVVDSALRRRYSSPYTGGDAVSRCKRARDGVHARPERHGGGWSELVMDSKQRDVCTCTACGQAQCISAPQLGRLCGPQRVSGGSSGHDSGRIARVSAPRAFDHHAPPCPLWSHPRRPLEATPCRGAPGRELL